MRPVVDARFWRGRRVAVTGHTGFKGAWLTLWLAAMGARVVGLTRGPPSPRSLHALAGVARDAEVVRADVRDAGAVLAALARHAPEIVFHLAAQPLVGPSLTDPRTTYAVNVLGTVNVLEAVRATPSVRAAVVVTTDRCYAADPARPGRPFREEDPMGGSDPYSSSKACAELVARAYGRSFLQSAGDGPRLATARAGNLVGGGDWGRDRLIPDMMRGALAGRPIPLRDPEAVRPWQHVLNALSGYLLLAEALHASPAASGGWNFGAPHGDARPVRWIADRLTELWPGELRWEPAPGPHPRQPLVHALDSAKARAQLGWEPVWDLEAALVSLVAWYDALRAGADMRAVTLGQIEQFAAAGAGAPVGASA
jgi:CDP-glucose 4,6-dehydratase